MSKSRPAPIQVRIPSETVEVLRHAADENGRSLHAEILSRIDATLGPVRETGSGAAPDKKTTELVQRVASLAEHIQEAYGVSWHSDTWAHAVFVAGLKHLAKKESVSGAVRAPTAAKEYGDLTPEQLGVILADFVGPY